MNRLNITFQTLAASPSEAVLGVLAVALADPETMVRSLAIGALAKRTEPRSGEVLLRHWSTFTDEQVNELRAAPGQLLGAVAHAVHTQNELVIEAIDAARKLECFELLPQLVDIAQSHELNTTRQVALEAATELAATLGSQARQGSDVGYVRAAATSRLAKSIRSFPVHRSHGLVDAFLVASKSSDTLLNDFLAKDSVSRKVVLNRLTACSSEGVANLLASFIRRVRLQPEISSLILTLTDAKFRSALLEYVGTNPGNAVLGHFQAIGRPACCESDAAFAAGLPAEQHAALLHILAETTQSPAALLRFIVATIRRDEPATTQAAVDVLQRCDSPDVVFWIKAAIELARDFTARVTLSENAMLLGDLIDLLSHGQATVVKGIQRVLEPLHASSIVPYMSRLDASNRNSLGSILMMIDPAAVDSVRDRLKHPILKNRIEAITAAESLGIVDLLVDSFTYVVRNDHQEARRAAAIAMSLASSRQTLDLLREMVAMPESSVRDEAVRALELRTRTAVPVVGIDAVFANLPVTQ